LAAGARKNVDLSYAAALLILTARTATSSQQGAGPLPSGECERGCLSRLPTGTRARVCRRACRDAAIGITATKNSWNQGRETSNLRLPPPCVGKA
jgi:hypothetical protein